MNMKHISILVFLVFMSSYSICGKSHDLDCKFVTSGKSVCRISIYTLIASPKSYSGEEVLVTGYLAIDYGRLKLWTTQDSFEFDIDPDSIAMHIPYSKAVELAKRSNRKYCSVIGTFKYAPKQEFGIHSALSELTHITRVWCPGKRIDTELDREILMEIDH